MGLTKVIGIDPSGSFSKNKGITGVSFVYYTDGDIEVKRLDEINNANFSTYEELLNGYRNYFEPYDKEGTIVVIEDYIKNPAKEGLHKFGIEETTQLIGTLKAIFKNAEVVMQMNTNIHQGNYPREGLFGIQNLYKYGYATMNLQGIYYYNVKAEGQVRWYASVKHKQDALAHALYYLLSQDVDIYNIKKKD